MNKKGILVKDAEIFVLGFTFKENCPDIRNTKVIDIITTLKEYTNNITVYDPWANAGKVESEYGIKLCKKNVEALENKFDVVVLAVPHSDFAVLNPRKFLKIENGVVYDVKSFFDRKYVDGRL